MESLFVWCSYGFSLKTEEVVELLKDYHMSILYHVDKDNIVVDASSRLCMCSTVHVDKEKRELAKYMHILVCLEVRLMDSTEGGVVVMNGDESSLAFEMKEKQNKDPIFLELKANVNKQKSISF